MAYVDFSDFSDAPENPVPGQYTSPPVDRPPDTPLPGGTGGPIGTGPITTQPLPRGPVIDPEVPGATTPTAPGSTSGAYVMGGNPLFDRIARFYTGVSGGRYTPTQRDVSQWGTNLDENYLGNINLAIHNWWETNKDKFGATPTTTTPGTPTADPVALIRQYQATHPAAGGAALDDLVAFLRQNGVQASRYVDPTYGTSNNELDFGQGKYKVYSEGNGTWYQGGNDSGGRTTTGGVSPNGMGYDDPSAQIYLQQLASRLNQLNNPQPDPWENILKLFALARVGNLSGDPYTGAEDAALVAHYRDPLTEARDASLQRNKERIGARGMASTSGLLDVLNRGTEQTYERGIASGSNDLAVRAVQEKQRRADEQLAILGNILGVNRTGVDRKNELADRAVSIAQMFPNFDAQRLDMLLRASGEGAANPNSTMANLTSLGNLGLTSSIYQNNQDQANAAFWGQLIASLIPAQRTA